MTTTKEIELYDITPEQAVVYADFTIIDGDLQTDVNALAISKKDLKDFITEEQLNVEISPVGTDRIYNVCTYLNDNLRDVVREYLEAKYAN